MFLVNHNESQIGNRGKDRGTRANHNLRVASTDPLPFIETFAFGQL